MKCRHAFLISLALSSTACTHTDAVQHLRFTGQLINDKGQPVLGQKLMVKRNKPGPSDLSAIRQEAMSLSNVSGQFLVEETYGYGGARFLNVIPVPWEYTQPLEKGQSVYLCMPIMGQPSGQWTVIRVPFQPGEPLSLGNITLPAIAGQP